MIADIVGGVASGIAQVIIMMPFDLVKVRVQEDSKVAPKYQGPIHCVKTILA
jgi:solute carrier family 25 carnitine/acylcarnitine transporter 20/29